MTTDTAIEAAQVADEAQTTSDPVTDAKPESEAQEGEVVKTEGEPELSEVEKAKAEAKAAFEKRIARQTAANRDQQRQLQEAKARIAELEKLSQSIKPLDDKPNQDNFETFEEFTDALADWKLAQKEKAKGEEANKGKTVEDQVKAQVEFEKKRLEFETRENAFRSREPEYEKHAAVVNKFLGLADPKSETYQAFGQTVASSERAPELINYLGKNPQEIVEMFHMTPYELKDRLDEIIDTFADAPKATPRELPAPPNAVKGSTRVSKSPDQMSGRELVDRYLKGKV